MCHLSFGSLAASTWLIQQRQPALCCIGHCVRGRCAVGGVRGRYAATRMQRVVCSAAVERGCGPKWLTKRRVHATRGTTRRPAHRSASHVMRSPTCRRDGWRRRARRCPRKRRIETRRTVACRSESSRAAWRHSRHRQGSPQPRWDRETRESRARRRRGVRAVRGAGEATAGWEGSENLLAPTAWSSSGDSRRHRLGRSVARRRLAWRQVRCRIRRSSRAHTAARGTARASGHRHRHHHRRRRRHRHRW